MAKYKICDLIIEMNPLFNPLKTQSEAYLIADGFNVDLDIPNLEKRVKLYHGKNPQISLGNAEYLLYGSYFYTHLINFQGILLHASAVVYENRAYLFSAPSGIGKSTHTDLWLKTFKGAFILNDDKPAIKLFNNQLYAYGTPFSGKTDLNVNEKYPIQAICFIERAENNWIKKMSKKGAITNLYGQTVRSKAEERVDLIFELLEKIIVTIPIYQMGLTISKEAVLLAYNTMRGQNK